MLVKKTQQNIKQIFAANRDKDKSLLKEFNWFGLTLQS